MNKNYNLYYFNKKTGKYKNITAVVGFFVLSLILSIFWTRNNILQSSAEPNLDFGNQVLIKDTVFIEKEDTFSEEKLIQMLKDLNVRYPHIVLAQARLETGNYQSKIFNENNNLFGMKEARVRAHTAICSQYNHACYNNWRDSVIDYALYQSRYMSDCKSENQYFRKLGRSYAEAKNYVASLQRIIKRDALESHFLE